jgi:hypothetical protein
MNIKGLIIAILLIDLAACTASSPPQVVNNPSSITTPGIATPGLVSASAAPEIEEITVTSPDQQRNIGEGSAITKNVPIAQPPLISSETIDCILELAINKECAGFNIDDKD